MVLNGLLDQLGLAGKSTEVLRSLDKLAKIGRDKVVHEMTALAGIPEDRSREVVRLGEIAGTNDEILKQAEALVEHNELGRGGVDRLAETLRGVRAAGVPDENIQLDVAIARGLDYYTGTVYETFLHELPEIGSVCSGGRYDNLADLFTKQELPGVGASLGLDRLLAAMEKLKMLETVRTPAPVFIAYFDKQRLGDYLNLAATLRGAGLGAELFPDPKKLGQQLKYADSRGFAVALIAGENEFEANTCQVKNLRTGDRHDVSLADGPGELVAAIRAVLEAAQ
jgi:histidyl-tRNA synthetase